MIDVYKDGVWFTVSISDAIVDRENADDKTFFEVSEVTCLTIYNQSNDDEYDEGDSDIIEEWLGYVESADLYCELCSNYLGV